MLLARTGSGTLTLSVDERGLRYEFDAPNTTAGNDLLEMLKRGDVSQSSFAFTVKDEKWDEVKAEMPIRTITKVKRLYDVSPVTYPAYPDTTVAKRSLDAAKKQEQPEPKEEVIIRRRTYWR
jgi:HK97 family phage prohead protease